MHARFGEKLVYINGIRTPPEKLRRDIAALESSPGSPSVTAVYNPSTSTLADMARGYAVHFKGRSDPTVRDLTTRLTAASCVSDGPVFVAHSQGIAVLAQALRCTRQELSERLSPTEVQERLARLKIETHGAAGARLIDGPQYVHYVNRRDPVPNGMGYAPNLRLATLHTAGAGAVFRYFDEVRQPAVGAARAGYLTAVEETVHDIKIYAPHRESFAVARARAGDTSAAYPWSVRLKWSPLRLLWDVLSLPITIVQLMRGA